MLKKLDYIKILKIAAGAGMAVVAAQALGLNYSTSAGVITLLSIQNTKKETIRVMALRLCSFGIALILAAISFSLFGYGALALGVFLLCFSSVSLLFGMQEGISVNTVLMTHFMAEQSMSLQNVGNELAILVIGAGIGVGLNLYIPGKEKQIRAKQKEIESRMKIILTDMAELLSASATACLESAERASSESLQGNLLELEGELKLGEQQAYEEMENKLLTETRYYLRYMNMRRVQSAVLRRIAENISHLRMLPPQSEQISHFLGQISASFHEHNNAVELIGRLGQVKSSMREQALPETRDEFESRAVLYGILLELEQFLGIKKTFVEDLTDGEIKNFWGKPDD